jgi:2'-5' RNA ligase
MGRVTAVVCAAFDPPTDQAIYAVRELVRDAGIALPYRPPHRPHLSLAAARVDQGDELANVLAIAREVATRHRPIALTLTEVGRFGRPGVLWLGAPHPARHLAALQRDADAALRAAGWPRALGERSDPIRWVAHCTLATRIPKPQLREVQAAVRERCAPILARVDAVATILVGGSGDVDYAPLLAG